MKKVDFMNTQKKIEMRIERKMDENKEHMKGTMEQLEQKIMEALNGRFPKINKVSGGTHENKGSIQIEQLCNNKNFPGGFNSNSGVTYGWSPKGVNLTKVELRKFDGT